MARWASEPRLAPHQRRGTAEKHRNPEGCGQQTGFIWKPRRIPERRDEASMGEDRRKRTRYDVRYPVLIMTPR
ncbi:MAG TPA: hypothetical protein VEI04_08865, partial [Syntrophobacteria bacterium]|nr:hypothetical protein [Syntrophobacteria bacterium]